MAEIGPEEVVRQFLEAGAHLRPSAEFTTGLLHTLSLVSDETIVGTQSTSEHGAANIRSMRLREEQDGRAVIDLDAFVVHHVKSSQHFGVVADYRFCGPVELHQESDGWKIASVVQDGIALPEAIYEPVVDRLLGGCAVTALGQPTKKGAALLVHVTNGTDHSVVVSEIELTVRFLRWLHFRWGNVRLPKILGPGESWGGTAVWAPVGLRKTLGARIVVAGEEVVVALAPAKTRTRSTRVRLRHLDGTGIFLGVLVVFGLANAVATSWRGWGFLGISLAVGGTWYAARGAILEVAGFRSSGSVSLLVGGAIATVGGSAIMLRHGLGWIGVLVIIGTMVFAMQAGFAGARHIGRLRARQLENANT